MNLRWMAFWGCERKVSWRMGKLLWNNSPDGWSGLAESSTGIVKSNRSASITNITTLSNCGGIQVSSTAATMLGVHSAISGKT